MSDTTTTQDTTYEQRALALAADYARNVDAYHELVRAAQRRHQRELALLRAGFETQQREVQVQLVALLVN